MNLNLHNLMYGDNEDPILDLLNKGFNDLLIKGECEYEWPILKEQRIKRNKLKLLLK